MDRPARGWLKWVLVAAPLAILTFLSGSGALLAAGGIALTVGVASSSGLSLPHTIAILLAGVFVGVLLPSRAKPAVEEECTDSYGQVLPRCA
jgi:membrane protein implicated in regulation of membrane protease activity